MTTDLSAVFASAEAVLFDFDGPLCDVFAGLPAWRIARELQEAAGTQYDTDDPLEVLRRAAETTVNTIWEPIEDALIAAELNAVKSSTALSAGVRSLRTALDAGLRVGVVSNNSATAVNAFMQSHELGKRVNPVIGRAYRRPALMKPNPWPMEEATHALGIDAKRAVFIGDSISDIEVASLVKMPCVAYANKPGKRELFSATDAVVIDDMQSVVEALMARVST